MDTMDKKDNIVDGYYFESDQEAQLAKKELRGIEYLNVKNNMKDSKVTIQMYHKLLDQQVFQTPVGIGYLKQLQQKIKNKNPRRDIPPIPVKKGEEVSDNAFAIRKKMLEFDDVGGNYHKKWKISMLINVSLAIALIVMIIIASTTNNPNIINYENKIIDKYEHWQNELTQREEQLRQNTNNKQE